MHDTVRVRRLWQRRSLHRLHRTSRLNFAGPDCDRKSILLKRSFLAVWTATIASKGSFCRVFQNLQDLHSFAPLQSQNLQIILQFFSRKFPDFCKILLIFCEISAKISNILTQICKISEIRTVQKDANLVDLEKCCKMRLCSLS